MYRCVCIFICTKVCICSCIRVKFFHIHDACAYVSVDKREMFLYIVEATDGACSPRHSAAPRLWGKDGLPECLINVKERLFSHNLKHAVVSCLSTCFLADMTRRGDINLWIFFYTWSEAAGVAGGVGWAAGRLEALNGGLMFLSSKRQ